MDQPHSHLRRGFFCISLGELLLVVCTIAVGCAALKYASETWWLVLSACALLLLMTTAVVAIAGHGRTQTMAKGFVACVAIFGLLYWSAPRRLPTTKILQSRYEVVMTRTWFDMTTGLLLPNYDPKKDPNVSFGPRVSLLQVPDTESFMMIGHLLWALLFGYFGGRLAGWLHDQRLVRQLFDNPAARLNSSANFDI